MREAAADLSILGVAVRSQALVALLAILPAQRFRIE
jgi:hypothetical protein